MTVLLVVYLLTYAALLGVVAEALLGNWSYLTRSPRVALWLWHATAAGVLTSICAALLVLAHDVWEHSLAWALHADKGLIHGVYASPGEVDQAWNGSVLLLGLLLSLFAKMTFQSLCHVRKLGRAHQLLATRRLRGSSSTGTPELGLIPHHAPAIYCVAGRKAAPRILVTTGAVDVLTAQQLDAALEHERAHLRNHHHTMTMVADVVHRLTCCFGLLRHYPRAVRDLVEVAADDAAADKHGRNTVAAALLNMSAAPSTPTQPLLGWTGADPASRIRRLLRTPQSGLGRPASVVLCLAAVVIAALPAGATIGPAASLVGSAHDMERSTIEQQADQSGPTKFEHHQ